MSNRPTIAMLPAASRDAGNAVWEAMGRGPNSFIIKFVDDPDLLDRPDPWNATPTHYGLQDMSASAEDAATWQAICEGDLPLIEGTWGEEGVISAQDAQTYLGNGLLKVVVGSGYDTVQEAQQLIAGAASGSNLHMIPDNPDP